MRIPFRPTLLATALPLALSGCIFGKPVELPLQPSQSQYDDRMLDSLGTQRYSEAQIIYNRQLHEFEKRVKDLEEQRRALEASLAVNSYEKDKTGRGGDSAEAGRIEEFQAATHASQSRVAQENANAATRQALIENARDRELVEAERKAAQRLAAAADEDAALRAKRAESSATATRNAVVESQTKRAEADSQLIIGEARAKNDQDRLIAEAESRAASRIAEIESSGAKEINSAEERIAQDIASKKRVDSLARDAAARVHTQESQILDEQRITVAVANAEAERRTAADIATQQHAIEQHRADTQALLAPIQYDIEQRKSQIAEINRQITGLESKMASVQAEQNLRLAPLEAKLAQLQAEAVRLAGVSQKLKTTPLTPKASTASTEPSAEAAQYIAAKESELSRTKAEILARQGGQVAAIRSQLAAEIASIKTSTRSQIASLQTGTERTKASITPITTPAPGGEAEVLAAKSAREARINAELAAEKADINARARTEIARLAGTTEINKANVVAPVVTGRAVYAGSYGEKPAPYAREEKHLTTDQSRSDTKPPAAPSKQAQPAPMPKPLTSAGTTKPVEVVAKFEPKVKDKPQVDGLGDVGNVVLSSQVAGAGGVQPIVVAPKNRTAYNVVYVYKDQASFTKFQNYLKAYGINDFEAVNAKGEYIIHAGRYYDAESAARRVAYLNKTTSTNHAKVIQEEVAR